MSRTTLGRLFLATGFVCVVVSGCATPFRPTGWVCCKMTSHDSQSLVFCGIRSGRVSAEKHSQPLELCREFQADPFLAFDD